jgi:hypothetical protein
MNETLGLMHQQNEPGRISLPSDSVVEYYRLLFNLIHIKIYPSLSLSPLVCVGPSYAVLCHIESIGIEIQ